MEESHVFWSSDSPKGSGFNDVNIFEIFYLCLDKCSTSLDRKTTQSGSRRAMCVYYIKKCILSQNRTFSIDSKNNWSKSYIELFMTLEFRLYFWEYNFRNQIIILTHFITICRWIMIISHILQYCNLKSGGAEEKIRELHSIFGKRS